VQSVLEERVPAYRTMRLPGPVLFKRGGELPEATLAYEIWGELSPARDNALLLTTGLSPGSHARSTPENPAAGWWEEMIGPGRPIDTDRWFVVCNNSLGSCHGSTGPASIDPRSGEPYRLSFPTLSVEDIASSSRALLLELGIERLGAVVGSSLGGMTALAYALLFPSEVERLVTISAASAASPFAVALRSIQREAIRNDPAWDGGRYAPGRGPRKGMALARKLGVVTYRSPEEWKARFGRRRVDGAKEPFGAEFEVEAYLQSHAERFVPTFDANSYLYLSRAMDLFDASELGASLEDALARVAARVLVIGVESDILFPIEQQRALAEAFRAAGMQPTFAALPSVQGHDSFLIDLPRFGPVIADFLKAD
jgi:homoserine O-acetyltransferase